MILIYSTSGLYLVLFGSLKNWALMLGMGFNYVNSRGVFIFKIPISNFSKRNLEQTI